MIAGTRASSGISFRLKLAVGISVLSLGIVTAVGVILTDRHDAYLTRELHRKGDFITQLLGLQLQPVIAFDDRMTAREVFESIAIDSDVEGLAVYTSNGTLIQGRGTFPRTPPTRAATGSNVFISTVVSPEGPRGTAIVRLGTRRLAAERRSSVVASLAVGAITAFIAFVLAWLFAQSVTRRLGRIADASARIASGDLGGVAMPRGANDEIGRLAEAFNSMVGNLRDAFAQRERAAEEYRLIVEGTKVIPFAFDPVEGRFTYVGPQAASILGYEPARWQEPNFLEKLIEASERSSLRSKLVESLADFETEFTATSSLGRTMYLRMIASYDRGDDQAVRGVMFDITDRKRLECELAQAQKLESIGRLAAGVAHEINTPIQFVSDSVRFAGDAFVDVLPVIASYQRLKDAVRSEAPSSQLLALANEADELATIADLSYLNEEIPKSIALAIDGLKRVATIVRSMKAFSHPGHHEIAATDLNHAILSTLNIARNEYKYVAELKTDLADLPPVHCNAGEINQTVLNIVINAAHAIRDRVTGTHDKGVITVLTRQDGDDVVIQIGDTGSGIPERVRAHIFEPFFTTKQVGTGTGQGLAIARSVIVEKHRGLLSFDTTLGVGTTFSIRLPIGMPAVLEELASSHR